MQRQTAVACVVMLVVVLLAPVAVFAQRWTVAIVEVRPDGVREYEALQKELNAAYRAGGVTDRRIFQTARGPASEYLLAQRFDSFAEYDETERIVQHLGAAGAAQWIARVTKLVEHRRIETWQERPDLSIPLAEGRAPTLLSLRITEHLPGRRPDYTDWLRETWMPALTNAGADGVIRFQTLNGGNIRTWYEATSLDEWADLDAPHPVRRAVGEEAWGELLRTSGAMTYGPVVKILRIRRDLSLVP